ncbi:MAG: acyl carrier protein [Candidatus Eisenbacteria bacterium]|nr:acyl carrier protein [Candidatus Eisenbacteria bacterium]MCC7144565.1 acyl carrier protein [Candidatus Eisenbacteria bacterium]
MDEVEQKVLSFVKKEYLDEDDDTELDENSPLITSGIVDSFSMVSLKTFLERQYQIKIPDERASAEAFDTVAKIAAVVREIRGN